MRLVIHQIQGMLPLREALDVLEHNAVQVHADGIVNEQGVLYVDDDAAGRVVEILAAICKRRARADDQPEYTSEP